MAGDTLKRRLAKNEIIAGAMIFEFVTPGIAQLA